MMKRIHSFSVLLIMALVVALAMPALAETGAFSGPYEIVETEVEIPSRDVTLTAMLTVPQTDAEKYPVAILTHGFMVDYSNCEDIAEYLGKRGIACLRINLMGAGTSGGRYQDSDFDTQADDIVNALHYAQTLDIADTNNMFLIGKSQGGFDSGLAALKVEEEINALIMWFPGLGIPDDFRSGKIMFAPFDVNNVPETVEVTDTCTVGKKMIEQALAMQIEDVFPFFNKEVLIIHGEDDQVVSAEYSQKIAPLYPDATLIVLPNAGHGFRDAKSKLDALAYTYAFIENHLSK